MMHSNTGDDLSLSFRMKSMTGREKIAYLWYYYKWLVLGVLFGAVLLGWFLHDWIQASNSGAILNVTLVNAAPAEDGALFADFPRLLGYEGEGEVYVDDTVSIDLEHADARSAQAFQILAAEFTVGEIDLFVSDEALFGRMADNGGFLPLEALFPEGLPEAWADRLYYHEDPQTGEKSACGLLLTEGPLHGAGCYPPGQPLLAGVGGRSARAEEAAEMLLYLTGQPVRPIGEE